MQVPQRHSYPPEIHSRRAKRAKRDRVSDATSTNAEEGHNHEVAGRPINKRTNLDLSGMEVIPAMFNRLTWFVNKEPNQPTASNASEPKLSPAGEANHPPSRPANPSTSGRGRTKASSAKADIARQTSAIATVTEAQPKLSESQKDAAQPGRKRARNTEANETQPGPIVVQPTSPSPTTANSVNGRKILAPTRVSERLKKKAAGAQA